MNISKTQLVSGFWKCEENVPISGTERNLFVYIYICISFVYFLAPCVYFSSWLPNTYHTLHSRAIFSCIYHSVLLSEALNRKPKNYAWRVHSFMYSIHLIPFNQEYPMIIRSVLWFYLLISLSIYFGFCNCTMKETSKLYNHHYLLHEKRPIQSP